MLLGATFIVDDKEYYSLDTWKIKLVGINIPSPETKTYIIDVPFGNSIDLTDVFGNVSYNNRNIELTFEKTDDNWIDWTVLSSDIRSKLHGRKCKVILDTDKDYYWLGRVSIDTKKEVYNKSEFTININAEPYKYTKESSNSKWIWDTFNFKNGIIRNYIDVVVNGSKVLNIVGGDKPTTLTLKTSAAIKVSNGYMETTLPKAGTYEIPDIEIVNGINRITFTGNATVTVDYRGSSL